VLDRRFAKYRLGSAAVERLATGFRWTEGLVRFGDRRCLLFSDIPNGRIGQILLPEKCANLLQPAV
jgi:gluconolactonase